EMRGALATPAATALMLPTDSAYVATKGAVEQFAHVLAKKPASTPRMRRGILKKPLGSSDPGSGFSPQSSHLIGLPDRARGFRREAGRYPPRLLPFLLGRRGPMGRAIERNQGQAPRPLRRQ